ncbi:MAG: histone family protein [Promethearchaeota archaeon]
MEYLDPDEIKSLIHQNIERVKIHQSRQRKLLKEMRSHQSGIFASTRIEKLIRSAGAQRVSVGAIEALNQLLTEHGTKIVEHAVELAQNANRKTVKASDIRLAADHLNL